MSFLRTLTRTSNSLFKLSSWSRNMLTVSQAPFDKATNYHATPNISHLPLTEMTTLENGFRVGSEQWDSQTCTVGIYIDVGSRFETDANNGVAHFLEHMAFKGTNKRSQKDLELEVENRGAHLNAYTSREMTVFYAKCMSKDVDWAVELLADILKNSKLEQSQIERERQVILREMEEVASNYQEVVFDYLHSTAYQGTPLGRTILGPVANIKSLTRDDLAHFISSQYKAPKMVLAAAGGVEHARLARLAEQHFGDVSCNYPDGIPKLSPCRYTGSELRDRDDAIPLAHVAIAQEGPGWSHADTIPLMIGSSVHGAWDRSHSNSVNLASSLASGFSAVPGQCHSFQHFFTIYHDTSLWGLYFTAEQLPLQRVTEAFMKEWTRMATSITDFEVERAKNQLKTNLMQQLDGTTPTCEEIGRQLIVYGRRIPVDEMMARIDIVDSDKVRQTLEKYLYDKCPAVAALGPTEGLLDYWRVRNSLRWTRF